MAEMRGLFRQLSPEQQAAALAYDGPEDFGPPDAPKHREAVMYIAAIKLPAGKLAAQVAHAAVECFREGKRNRRRYRARKVWLYNPAKVVLRMHNMDQAAALLDAADRLSLSRAVICDAGRTVVKAGTVTAVAVGPVFRDEDGPWTAMKLY